MTATEGQDAVLAAALASLPSGLWIFGGDHRLVFANAAARACAGLEAEALPQGTPLGELVRLCAYRGVYGPGDPEVLAERLLSLDRSRPLRRLLRRADGSSHELRSVPLPGGGFCSTLLDVSPFAAAVEEANARLRRTETVLAHLHRGVALFDSQRRLLLSNPGYEDLLGLQRGTSHAGQTHEEVLHLLARRGEFDNVDAEAIVAACVALDRSRPQVYARERPNGTVLRFESHPTPEGGYLLEVADITPLQRAEDEARRRAALLDGVLAALPLGVLVFGPDHRVAMVNAAYQQGVPGSPIGIGEHREEIARRHALACGCGPGETEALAPRRLGDRSDSNRRSLHRHPNGTILDIRHAPLPDGGYVQVATDITALHQAEARATERAELLQAMLDTMHHGIALYGPDRRLRLANRLAYDLAGLSPEEMRPGRILDDLVRLQAARGALGEGQDSAEAAEWLIRLDRSRSHSGLRRRADGRVIELATHPTPDGGFVVTWSDVTPRAQAEQEAREHAAVLRATLDNVRHGIAMYGPDRRLVTANRLAGSDGGLPGLEARVGAHFDDLVREQLATGLFGKGEAAERIAAELLATDRSVSHQCHRVLTDGKVIEVESHPTPDGGFIVTHSDVSRLVRAQAQAAQRAATLQMMLDNIRHGICLVDAEGCIVAANPVFRQILHLPEGVVAPGRPYADFVAWLEARGEYGSGADGAEVAATIRARDRSRSIRSVRSRPDGTVLEVVSDPTPDGGFVLTFTDVTEDRRIRAELETAKEAAETANRAKSRFLATMSHELRTPLNAVIGFSQALMNGPDPVMAAEFARSIHEAGRHLLSLIDNILDATRAETTGFQIAESEVDVAALAAGALRVLGTSAAAGEVALRAELPPALPLVRADALRLRQVLLNLLSNAVKFTPAGGSVTLSAAPEADGGLVLRVTDTGIGMRPEDIPRAFEPFTQLDSSFSRQFQGSGLGLYLARALAAAQGAELTLDSVPGQGTTARLRFPPDRLLTPVAA